jgi:CHAD domain-containing protein
VAPAAPDSGARYRPPALDPIAPASAASRLLLASLGTAVRRHAEDVCRGDVREAVHDLRVSLRRTRALLGASRGVFTLSEIQRLRRGVRWLSELSGPPRDLEILLERLQSSRKGADDEERPAFDALIARVGSDRDRARKALLRGLCGSRYQRLMEVWAGFTVQAPEAPSGAVPGGRRSRGRPRGQQPIAVVGAEAVDRAWRRLVRHGKALEAGSAMGAFHRVRIDGKKLRYLLELFRSAYPAVDLSAAIARLRSLMVCLGDLNDAQMQEAALRRIADDLSGRQGASPEAFLLLGRMIERSNAAAKDARRRCRERFDELRRREHRNRIRSLAGVAASSVAAAEAAAEAPAAEGVGAAEPEAVLEHR